MTNTTSSPPLPQAKASMPPLDARAPRPPVVRLRRGVVVGTVLGGALLVSGSLVWAFVAQPELRARALAAGRETPEARGDGAVRPSEIVTDGPSSYAQLDRLPEARGLGKPDAPAKPPAPPASQPVPQHTAPSHQVGQEARSSALFFAANHIMTPSPTASPAGRTRDTDPDYGAVYNTHSLLAPLSPHEVKAGAIIPAALLTGIDTSRAGPVVAAVTESVFDTVTGRRLLIPQGARLIGRHEGESRHGDKRAFLVWDRLILPNGKSLMLAAQPGVDAQGIVGVRGEADRRLGALITATLFAGAITTLGQAARDSEGTSGGWLGDAGDAAAIEGAQVGGKLIDRELEVRPTIRLRPGERVRVLITRDLVLEPYQP